jgi:hypothetical protein
MGGFKINYEFTIVNHQSKTSNINNAHLVYKGNALLKNEARGACEISLPAEFCWVLPSFSNQLFRRFFLY